MNLYYSAGIMNDDLFTNYSKLLAKVDDFSLHLIRIHRDDIVCRRGCLDCCRQDLHLLPVEFLYLKQRLRCQPKAEKIIRQNTRPESCCILLHEGGCLLYEHRPVICRTHGLPLLITEDGRERRDCCPKNFTGQSIGYLPKTGLLHLERLNTMLIVVNLDFASRAGLNPEERIPVSRLAVSRGEKVSL
jgi:hypothetical protein